MLDLSMLKVVKEKRFEKKVHYNWDFESRWESAQATLFNATADKVSWHTGLYPNPEIYHVYIMSVYALFSLFFFLFLTFITKRNSTL